MSTRIRPAVAAVIAIATFVVAACGPGDGSPPPPSSPASAPSAGTSASPAAGVFNPDPRWVDAGDDAAVEVGELLGTVGTVEVRSLFSGVVQGFIAVDGERVTPSQPIAWLRTV